MIKIKFKEFVNSNFRTHEQAMKVLAISKTSFYRRMKCSSSVVFVEKKSNSDTVFYIAKVESELLVHSE